MIPHLKKSGQKVKSESKNNKITITPNIFNIQDKNQYDKAKFPQSLHQFVDLKLILLIFSTSEIDTF